MGLTEEDRMVITLFPEFRIFPLKKNLQSQLPDIIFCGNQDQRILAYHENHMGAGHIVELDDGPLIFSPRHPNYTPEKEREIWRRVAELTPAKTNQIFLHFGFPWTVNEKTLSLIGLVNEIKYIVEQVFGALYYAVHRRTERTHALLHVFDGEKHFVYQILR